MTATVPAEMRAFLGDATSRFVCERGYDKPFIVGGWRYATNGHVCIRIPAEGEVDTGGSHPDAPALDWSLVEGGEWLPWLEHCGKAITVYCRACDGVGTWEDMDLETVEPCEHCKQEGSWEQPADQDLGIKQSLIAGTFYAAIAALPDVEFYTLRSSKCYGPIRFRFTGGAGLVQPKDETYRDQY